MIKRLCFGMLFLLSFATSAQVKHVSEHGFVVENIIETTLAPSAIWQALTQDVDLWWPKDHSWWYGTFSIDAVAGGCFCEVNGSQSAEHMRIVFVDPNKVLRMSGGLGPLQGMGMNGALDWVMTPLENGTQVTLTYRVHGINPDGFAELAPIVAHVQGLQLGALKSYLEKSGD